MRGNLPTLPRYSASGGLRACPVSPDMRSCHGGRGGRARAPPSATGAPGEGVQGGQRSGAVDICLVIIS